MFSINLKHSLAIVAVAVGLLAAAGSASAGTHQFLAFSPQGPGSEGVRLGSNDGLAAGVKDGTSNTIAFGEPAAAARGFSVDIGTSENIATDGLGADYILMADTGGQF
jgi:hypothetical protein